GRISRNGAGAGPIELARHCPGRVRPWESLPEALAAADVVIAATAAPQPILDRALLEHVVRRRPDRPLLVVDAGLPRNVEPGSAVELIDIDALREQQETVRQKRQAAVPAGEGPGAGGTFALQRWRAGLPPGGVLQ